MTSAEELKPWLKRVMPISGEEYELGEIDPSLFTLQFLHSNFPNAYTRDELLSILTSQGKEISQKELDSILKQLVAAEKVEAKTIRDVVYYRYHKKPLGFMK